MISTTVAFNNAIKSASPIAGPITISGDIQNGSVFDLQSKTITNLTIDLTGLVNGEKITLQNGSVTNLTVIDKSGVTLVKKSVAINNETIK
ncbi:hypothetical protein AB1K89_14405 [Sporosarcina sp. 179-K 8C2 HS]|uniref:hypothetical protein n=1 Tax=Sporosarcina sp. 179-K 8C2 HS TaxID=3142387 RepID=UPI0039A0FE2B